MYKIKNFRLTLNKNTVWRNLKSKNDAELDDKMFERLFAEFERCLNPAAIFESVSRENSSAECGRLWEVCADEFSKWQDAQKPKAILAMTPAVVYLGQEIDNMSSAAINPEIFSAMSAYALELAGNFIFRIVREDALKEGCSAEKRILLDFGLFAEQLGSLIDINKIGICLSEGRALNPASSSFFCIPWTKKKKK